jgi:hypothetical protein
MADFNININADVTDDNNILGETVAIGDLVYLSNNSKWYKTSATLPSKSSTELRIALEAGVLDDTIPMLVYGYHTYTGSIVAGAKYYISITNGAITTAVYTETVNVIRYIGQGYDVNTLLFNPDQTYLSDNVRQISGVPINYEHDHVEADITDLDKYTQAEIDAMLVTSTDKNYVHTETPASASWVIAHNLGTQYVAVQCFDGSGNRVHGDITFTDVNNLTVTFNTAFAGTANLN